MLSSVILGLLLPLLSSAQLVGTNTPEQHPSISFATCSTGGSCTVQQSSVVLDSNWRWAHQGTSGSTNCYTGNAWDSNICSSPSACASNCAIEGADYSGTYGISTSGGDLTLKFVTQHQYGKNVGSRVYLMQPGSNEKYQIFKLKNKEFTFDADVSKMGCGLNGALYFVEMPEDGGKGAFSGNKAGAKYGTGYCDAQCPHDLKWINGEANVLDWQPSATDPNSGTGRYGACCAEMDIWEANSIATAFTPHTCSKEGLYRCEGTECGDGAERYQSVCDKDGCDFNSYRMGNTSFYGPNGVVNTNARMTVVTQFITTDGTDTGALKEIRRLYVQNGQVIQNSKVNIPGMTAYDSITDEFCVDQKNVFQDNNAYIQKGGNKVMGDAMERGMVLVMSIWADHAAHMLWLDSSYPLDRPESQPGVKRGTCPTSSGDPKDVESQQANAQAVFGGIKFGPIGSTFRA
ncbi:glycoside hydrolase [Ascodesmis nigricans]|uniref:Glucanase n=1 Tax=Ascodesmis nigricans TaxID=341454 RepID=A0A4S2N480_9PEZI|nr:glycoside hydrolase [Ascodesmis nigricans]